MRQSRIPRKLSMVSKDPRTRTLPRSSPSFHMPLEKTLYCSTQYALPQSDRIPSTTVKFEVPPLATRLPAPVILHPLACRLRWNVTVHLPWENSRDVASDSEWFGRHMGMAAPRQKTGPVLPNLFGAPLERETLQRTYKVLCCPSWQYSRWWFCDEQDIVSIC